MNGIDLLVISGVLVLVLLSSLLLSWEREQEIRRRQRERIRGTRR